MKTKFRFYIHVLIIFMLSACADNDLTERPLDTNYPLQLVFDVEEGGDLPDAEDYALEVKFADYLPGIKLPAHPITIHYTIADVMDDMDGSVTIDKVIYEVELEDCTYERELDFTVSDNGLSGTITLLPDPDLESVPESFEIIFHLPGLDDAKGSFSFEVTSIESTDNVFLGYPRVFEYEVLDNDVAGEWALTLATEEAFDRFKAIFAPLNPQLEAITFHDITGKVTAEFEFEEMKFVIELAETVMTTTCENGEAETEEENLLIEIEAEYDIDDNEITWEGSHVIVNDNGLEEEELDFIIEGKYTVNGSEITFTVFTVIDEDNFAEGEELFADDAGISFTFFRE